MPRRLSPAARLAVRRTMRARPDRKGDPLPPPHGTAAFWLEPHHGAGGGFVAQGPAVWARQDNGDSPGVWGSTPSDAIRRGLSARRMPRPLAEYYAAEAADWAAMTEFYAHRAPCDVPADVDP